jgi:hypothetical protein
MSLQAGGELGQRRPVQRGRVQVGQVLGAVAKFFHNSKLAGSLCSETALVGRKQFLDRGAAAATKATVIAARMWLLGVAAAEAQVRSNQVHQAAEGHISGGLFGYVLDRT